MGPSGAGKTTFMSVLMGKVARSSGKLVINGQEDEMVRYQKVIGFVPQDDTMIRELTVRENILYSARMRLPRQGWTDAAIQRHVDAVIDVLGLSECADTLIGDVSSRGVSGGQRKRLVPPPPPRRACEGALLASIYSFAQHQHRHRAGCGPRCDLPRVSGRPPLLHVASRRALR